MQIKIHESYRKLVAVCDSELIGKTYSQGIRQIEIKEGFFKGEEKNKKEIIEILRKMQSEDAIFNIVGEESVKTALEAGVIDEKGVMKIDGVPVALVLL